MQSRVAKILLAIFISIPLYSSGQKLINSPLARYNLGILEPAGSFRSLGMGGTGTALRDNSTIYFSNPASYSSLDTNSFVFDFGVDYGINIISDGISSDLSEDLNFGHLLMGFPITKKWGIATGIVPLSNGYYNISESVTKDDPGYDPITGEYSSYHGGSGGLTSFFLGTGLNITKNFSAGINMSLLFGSIKRYNEFDFADYAYTFQTNMTEKYQITGIGLDYGLQYSGSLKKNHFLNAGVSYSSSKHCKANYESIAFRYNAYTSSDTLQGYPIYDSTKVYIPGTLRAGVAFGKTNKFVVGIDYIYTRWSKADFLNSDGYTADMQNILFGVEYTPDRFSNYSFMKRNDYRIGGHIGNNYLILKEYGAKVKEFGFSFGTGIPLRRTFSKTNFFVDYTRRSVTGGSVTYNENYFTMGLSLNMYDMWFIKRKYD